MSNFEDRLNSAESNIKKLSSSRAWWIAALSALVAAIASVVTALISMSSSDNIARLENDMANKQLLLKRELGTLARKIQEQSVEVEANRIALDAYKHFGSIIASGEKTEQCNALVLISALSGRFFEDVEVQLSQEFECGEKTETALQNVIESRDTSYTEKPRCSGARATQTTSRKVNVEAANAYCKSLEYASDDYLGPWSNGRITFPTVHTIEGHRVWCNCKPKK